jgi:predicted NUDIX family phosphoesterase
MTQREERVLVVPTEIFHRAGLFQGFCGDVGRYLPAVLDPRHLLYLPRGAAEADPAFKQIIPYVVLRFRDLVFHYTRGKGGGEVRLRALRSIGIGGHISADDADGDPYRAGLLREIAEEVELDGGHRERCIGLINDDSTPVGQVHLGVVHVLELEAPTARRREEALADAGFAPLSELRRRAAEFETWSRFLLDVLPAWDAIC